MGERASTKEMIVGYPDGGITGPTAASVEGPTCAGREWPYEIVTSGAETVAIFPAQVTGGIESARESAVLFAAAPDMFEALWQCIGALKALGAQDGYASTAAKAAIAKAEGRTNHADAHKNPLPGEIAP